MEIRLLYGNELQMAVYTAHETFERCVRPYTRSQSEIDRYYRYVNVEHLWQEMSAGRLFLWGVFENGQMCAVSAMQSIGHITMLYVKPYCQRRKMGEQLVNYMCAYAVNILHKERVTIQVTPVSVAAFFYHIGFTLIQGAPLDNAQVPLERRIWMMPQGGLMQGQMYGNPAGAPMYGNPAGTPMYGNPAGPAPVYGNPVRMTPVYQVYTPPMPPKRPEVTYPTKKVSNKVIVGLVAGTLLLCFGIIAAVTVHHMATDGLLTEYECELDGAEEMDEEFVEEFGEPEEV